LEYIFLYFSFFTWNIIPWDLSLTAVETAFIHTTNQPLYLFIHWNPRKQNNREIIKWKKCHVPLGADG